MTGWKSIWHGGGSSGGDGVMVLWGIGRSGECVAVAVAVAVAAAVIVPEGLWRFVKKRR